MKRFLPVTKAAHQSEGNVYKNTGSLKTVKPAFPPILHTLYLWCFQWIYVLLPASGKHLVQSGIWTHYLKLMVVYFTVLYHTLSAVWHVRSNSVKSSWWIPLFWRHHPNSSPASLWEWWWKDGPCLSQFHCFPFTGLDGVLFCPLLWVTTTLLLYSCKPEESQRVSQKCWYLPGRLYSIRTQSFTIRR